MAVLNRDDFMNRINEIVGEDTSDKTLEFISDMSETFDSLNSGNQGWEQKYKDLDNNWRKKYKERFMQGSPTDDKSEDENVARDERANTITIADLFS